MRGLSFLHIKGVMHRDLKDANVLAFLDGAGELFAVKLGDVGIARVLEVGRLCVVLRSCTLV